MPRTLHFSSVEGYHKWLAFGHIHHKFHGRANIMIRGKHHAVVHKEHPTASHIHEYRQGGRHIAHKINYSLGRGTGIMVEGARSSRPYKTGKTKVPKKIWGGIEKGHNVGMGVNVRFPNLNLRI